MIIEVEVEETPIFCSKRVAEVTFPVPGIEDQEMVVEEADEEDDDKNKKERLLPLQFRLKKDQEQDPKQ